MEIVCLICKNLVFTFNLLDEKLFFKWIIEYSPFRATFVIPLFMRSNRMMVPLYHFFWLIILPSSDFLAFAPRRGFGD